MRILGIAFALLCCLLSSGWAGNQSFSWFSIDKNKHVRLRVDMFTSSTCPHCAKASQFFTDLEAKNDWLDIHRYVINQDKAALETYNQLLKQQQLHDFSVPAVFFCNIRWVGFVDAQTSGKQLLKSLNFCHSQLIKTGELSTTTEQILKQMSTAKWYEENLVSNLSAVTFIPIMVIMDVLNPSSIVVILALFSFLIIQKQQSMRLGSSILFLIFVGLAHTIQQVHTVFFYQMLSMLRVPVALIGLGLLSYALLFFSEKKVLPCAISLIVLVFTAFAVETYQQIHIPNFSMIFHQWVIAHGFTKFRQISYAIIYQLLYILSLGLLTQGLVFLIKNYRKWSRHQRIAEEFAWQYLVIIALLLLGYPSLLGNATAAFLIFILVLLTSWGRFKMNSYLI